MGVASTRPEDREQLYRSVRNWLAHGRLPQRTGLALGSFMGAIEVFCIALATSLPAVLRFCSSIIRGLRSALSRWKAAAFQGKLS
jgi:hypothetical protein